MQIDKNIETKDLYEDVIKDIKTHSELSSLLANNITFYGKSLKEHSSDFFIKIPEDKIVPEDFRKIFAKLIDLIQKAQFYYSISSSVTTTLSSGSTKKKADLIAAIIKSYEIKKIKRPGQEVISAMADSLMSETSNTLTISKIIKEFWKNKLDSLIEIRKCMEQIGINQATELKHLG